MEITIKEFIEGAQEAQGVTVIMMSSVPSALHAMPLTVA